MSTKSRLPTSRLRLVSPPGGIFCYQQLTDLGAPPSPAPYPAPASPTYSLSLPSDHPFYLATMQNHILLAILALISLVVTEGTTLSPRRGLEYSSCSSNFPGPFQISLIRLTPPTPAARVHCLPPPLPPLSPHHHSNCHTACPHHSHLCCDTTHSNCHTATTRGKVVAGLLGKHGNKWLGHDHVRGNENRVAGVD